MNDPLSNGHYETYGGVPIIPSPSLPLAYGMVGIDTSHLVLVHYDPTADAARSHAPRYGSVPPTLAECNARLGVIATEMAALTDRIGRLRGERERLQSRREQITR